MRPGGAAPQPGLPRDRLRSARRTDGRAAALARNPGVDRPRARPRGRGGRRRVLVRRAREQPGAARSREPQDPRDPARRDARRGDAPQGRHRDRREPRQDHHHLADRSRAAACGPRPDRGDRRSHPRVRRGPHRSATRRGQPARRRGGRERWQLPASRARDRSGHQHRPGAPRSLRELRSAAGRLHRLREQHSVLGARSALPRSPRRAGDPAAHDPPHDQLRLRFAGRPLCDASARGKRRNALQRAPPRRPARHGEAAPPGPPQRAERARHPGRGARARSAVRDRRCRARELRGHRASFRDQGSSRRGARHRRLRLTTRPRSARLSPPRARCMPDGSWSPSSRTATPAPATCGTSS